MKNFFTLIIATLGIGLTVQAQSPADIFRYSQQGLSGTARSLALGGAQTSLGADFGSLSYNPAGIALYRSSELSVTPGFYFTNGRTDINDQSLETNKAGLAFGGVGLVFTSHPRKRKQEKGWKFTNFGVGVNRVYNYNREYESASFNDTNSITDFFAENSAGYQESELNDNNLFEYGALAYRAYLIDPTDVNGTYTSILNGGQVEQSERIRESGAKNEILIDYGLNLKDKYYFGAALGIVSMNTRQETFFTERDEFGTYDNFDFLELSEEVITSGSGINLSVGAIMRLNKSLRFGASIKSPTRMSITETFGTTLRARALGPSGLETFEQNSPDGIFEYEYSEPYRVNAGLSYFIKQRALISVDYEMVDYGSMRVHYGEDAFADLEEALNQRIKSEYQALHTLRFGVETNFNDGLFLRGGLNTVMNRALIDDASSGIDNTISFGAGYRNERFMFDLAYANTPSRSIRQAYQLLNEEVPTVDLSNKLNTILLTLGTRF